MSLGIYRYEAKETNISVWGDGAAHQCCDIS